MVSLDLPGMAFPSGTPDSAELWPLRNQECQRVLGFWINMGNLRSLGRALKKENWLLEQKVSGGSGVHGVS